MMKSLNAHVNSIAPAGVFTTAFGPITIASGLVATLGLGGGVYSTLNDRGAGLSRNLGRGFSRRFLRQGIRAQPWVAGA